VEHRDLSCFICLPMFSTMRQVSRHVRGLYIVWIILCGRLFKRCSMMEFYYYTKKRGQNGSVNGSDSVTYKFPMPVTWARLSLSSEGQKQISRCCSWPCKRHDVAQSDSPLHTTMSSEDDLLGMIVPASRRVHVFIFTLLGQDSDLRVRYLRWVAVNCHEGIDLGP
jgi:hypothetical protein